MINLEELLQQQKDLLYEDKRKLGLLEAIEYRGEVNDDEVREIEVEIGGEEEKDNINENISGKENSGDCGNLLKKPCPVEKLELDQLLHCNERKKNNYADQVASQESKFMSRSDDRRVAMLRYGEYSPNNPELRVHSQPFLGIGEYEQQRHLLRERRRKDCVLNGDVVAANLNRNNKIQYDRENRNEAQKELSAQSVAEKEEENSEEGRRRTRKNTKTKLNNGDLLLLNSYRRPGVDDVATSEEVDGDEDDICRITTKTTTDNNGRRYRETTSDVEDKLDSVVIDMDKPKGILTNRKSGTSRDRFLSNLKHHNSYTPSFMDGFSYSDRTEELERERKKRETYNYDLRMQIEEKRRMQSVKDEQDRREQELENRRLEQQLLRMQEEALADDRGTTTTMRDEQVRRHSEDYLRRRPEMLGMRGSYRKHADSESSLLAAGGGRNVSLSHYSPPVSRRAAPFALGGGVSQTSFSDPLSSNRYVNPLSSTTASTRYDYDARTRRDALMRMDSLNIYDTLQRNSNDVAAASRYVGTTTSSSRRNPFARFDSLSGIDFLGGGGGAERPLSVDPYRPRRHSSTQNDPANNPACGVRSGAATVPRRGARFRSNSGGRYYNNGCLTTNCAPGVAPNHHAYGAGGACYDESPFPVPVLKARSPVARELKNSVPFDSSRTTTEACRRMEDRWQIPAVQKTIINHVDSSSTASRLDGGHGVPNRSILTQLGAIRMQLQKEQLRMDETLRKRGITQSKAVNFH